MKNILPYPAQITSLLIGSKGVGKTCYSISSCTGAFPGEYLPDKMELYDASVMVDGYPVSVSHIDTDIDWINGLDEIGELLPIADVIVFFFDLTNEASLWDIPYFWKSSIMEHWNEFVNSNKGRDKIQEQQTFWSNWGIEFEGYPHIILVGLKLDMRKQNESNSETIPTNLGLSVAHFIGARAYIETSGLCQDWECGRIWHSCARIAFNFKTKQASKKGNQKCRIQ